MNALAFPDTDLDRLALPVCQDSVVLVVNCGTAAAAGLADAGAKYVYAVVGGADADTSCSRVEQSNLRFLTADDVAGFAFPARHFDLICWTPGDGELPEASGFPTFARRVLKPGGTLLVAVGDGAAQAERGWSDWLAGHFTELWCHRRATGPPLATHESKFSGRIVAPVVFVARRPRPADALPGRAA